MLNVCEWASKLPQNTQFSFIAKFRGRLRQVQQVKLVNKIDEDCTAYKIDTYTKRHKFLKWIHKFIGFTANQKISNSIAVNSRPGWNLPYALYWTQQ